MKKRIINAADYASEIMKALPGGILLTTKAGEEVNVMTIGWGGIGVNWSKPVFTAYIRKHRHTVSLLDRNEEFTVSVPMSDFDKRILGICGSISGRDTDKVKEAGLTLVEPSQISVPAIREFPLTLECRVLYRQEQELALYDDSVMKMYPQDVDELNTGANKDPHITYIAEIVAAYIIED